MLEKAKARPLLSAIGRGFRNRCPHCGKGQLLRGYVTPTGDCAACNERLARYQTADFAPYLVTFAIGLIFMPIALALSLSGAVSNLAVLALIVVALSTALLLLPRMKGAAIGLLWALDVGTNQ
jgi:uncharacterized protein (DUF983 family)